MLKKQPLSHFVLFLKNYFILFVFIFKFLEGKPDFLSVIFKCRALSAIPPAIPCPPGWWSLGSTKIRLQLLCPDSISGNCLSPVTLLLSWRLPVTVTSSDTAQRVLVRTITIGMSPDCLAEPWAPESGYLRYFGV